MTTIIVDNVCFKHSNGAFHFESRDRIYAIIDKMISTGFYKDVDKISSYKIEDEHLLRAHTKRHVDYLSESSPENGSVEIDGDTCMNEHTLLAAKHSAGSGIIAVDIINDGKDKIVFNATRPPGHHAENDKPMGFCFYNNVAICALYALTKQKINKVAIIDFDVHHANGTVDIFKDDERVLVCSSFQYPFYPNRHQNTERDNIILTKLDSRCPGIDFRKKVEHDWGNALSNFKPDLIIVSAGFDAHEDDPLGDLCLVDDDYKWLGLYISDLAKLYSNGNIISFLEGGYDLNALANSSFNYLSALHEAP